MSHVPIQPGDIFREIDDDQQYFIISHETTYGANCWWMQNLSRPDRHETWEYAHILLDKNFYERVA